MFDEDGMRGRGEGPPPSVADDVAQGDITSRAGVRKAKPRKPSAQREAWSTGIEGPDRLGFFKLKDISLRTMDDRQFEDILTDDERWAKLEARMDADFTHALDMFPYAEEMDDTSASSLSFIERVSRGLGNLFKAEVKRRNMNDIELPQRFHAILRKDIEDRFPGGRERGEPGDGDIRDQLITFRQLFRENLAHYIFKKRQYQVLAVAAFVGALSALFIVREIVDKIFGPAIRQFYLYLAQFIPTTLSFDVGIDKLGDALGMAVNILLAVLLIGAAKKIYDAVLWTFKDRSQIIFDLYINSQTESCGRLDKQAALRTKNLFNLMLTMSARVDKDESVLDPESRAEEWPKRAHRWTIVVYWLGRRLENLERFVQIQMWLVRRVHYFYRLLAVGSNYAANIINGTLIWVAAMLVWCFADIRHNFGLLVTTFISMPLDWLKQQVFSFLGLFGVSFEKADGHPSAITEWMTPTLDRATAYVCEKRASMQWPCGPEIHYDGYELVFMPWVRQTIKDWGMLHGWEQIGNYVWVSFRDSANVLFHWAPMIFTFMLAWRLLAEISKLSGSNRWNTSLDLIKNNMDIANWDRFHSVNLPHMLANQVKADKNNILRRESWVSGKNR